MSKFSISIQEWYRQNHRDLPWRNTKNPYKIWLSEIILQQTRVDQGLNYYLKFVQHFPTVEDLAKADEQLVLNLWQGLGYYSRARNLHTAAQQIVNEFESEFPKNHSDIIQLKGVGDYTAAAIASFAFGLPHAVVDGNVYRVLSRYLGISTPIDTTEGKKQFQIAADELLDKNNPDAHNQAIMELGALVCTPKKPVCMYCPVNDTCMAFNQNKQLEYPVKAKKTKVKKRNHHYLVIFHQKNNEILVRKRTSNDIWKNMYDFPAVEKEGTITKDDVKNLLDALSLKDSQIHEIDTLQHKLTHREIEAKFFSVENNFPETVNSPYKFINMSELSTHPLPRLIDKFLEKNATFFEQ